MKVPMIAFGTVKHRWGCIGPKLSDDALARLRRTTLTKLPIVCEI
jgi:hypothetical protein